MSTNVETALAHAGVKGMKWGVRKSRNATASSDAKSAKAAMTKIGRKGDLSKLSNKEIKSLNERLNLEQNFRKASAKQKGAGDNMVTKALKNQGQKHVNAVVTTASTALIGAALAYNTGGAHRSNSGSTASVLAKSAVSGAKVAGRHTK